MAVKAVTGVQCDECGHMAREADKDSLYECDNCGTKWSRSNASESPAHKCPDCGKMSAKIGDKACPECGEGLMEPAELYEIVGAEDDGDELYESEDDAKDADDDPETEDAEIADEVERGTLQVSGTDSVMPV